MNNTTHKMIAALGYAGINYEDANALRRISMTLHRWHELECGDNYGRAIERDDATGKPYLTFDLGSNGKRSRSPVPDRERGALKRLEAIMARYPGWAYYIQGDPRGCALYMMPPGEMASREPGWLEANYNRGIAVHR